MHYFMKRGINLKCTQDLAIYLVILLLVELEYVTVILLSAFEKFSERLDLRS